MALGGKSGLAVGAAMSLRSNHARQPINAFARKSEGGSSKNITAAPTTKSSKLQPVADTKPKISLRRVRRAGRRPAGVVGTPLVDMMVPPRNVLAPGNNCTAV